MGRKVINVQIKLGVIGWVKLLLEALADVVSLGAVSRAYNLGVEGWAEADKLLDALEKIADCETSGANATVRRMARIANDAVEGK